MKYYTRISNEDFYALKLALVASGRVVMATQKIVYEYAGKVAEIDGMTLGQIDILCKEDKDARDKYYDESLSGLLGLFGYFSAEFPDFNRYLDNSYFTKRRH